MPRTLLHHPIALGEAIPVGEALVTHIRAVKGLVAEWFIIPRDEGGDAIIATVDARMIYGAERSRFGWSVVTEEGDVLGSATTLQYLAALIESYTTTCKRIARWNSTSARKAVRGMSTSPTRRPGTASGSPPARP